MPKATPEKTVTFGEYKPPLPSSLSITCAPCRTKKIKCDSTKPTCLNCAKNPEACKYVLKQKPGLRPGTGLEMIKRVELLEDRIETYEARLAEQEARLIQMGSGPFSGASFSFDNQTPSTDPMLSSNAFPPMDFQVRDPISSVMTQIPQSIPSTSQALPSVPNPFPTDPSPGTFDPFNLTTSPGIAFSSPSSALDPQILPPDDLIRDLIGLFFKHIHPWAPILSFEQPHDFNPPWSLIHYAIVVVSLRLSQDPRLGNKKGLRQRAKSHVLAHAIESTSISSVQALALLALDLIGSEQGPTSWGILALLTRSAVHLGLAVEDDSGPWASRAPAPGLSRTSIIPAPQTWQEDESRRRLFWLIFSLDRYACASTGWDFALPDFEIKRRLPCSDALWAQPEWYQTSMFSSVLHQTTSAMDFETLSPMTFLVEGLDLLGRAHTLQSKPIDAGDARGVEARKDATLTLTSAAKRWFAVLPLNGIAEAALRYTIQAIHYATLLKLNAYHAYPALSNGEPQEPYVSTCLSSTKAVATLAQQAKEDGWATASTPLFIWGCWVAARVLFVHAFLNHQLQPDEDFDAIVRSLKEQAVYWGLANQYVKLLERAKRKWLNASRDASTSSLPDAIHVLLDLRRTAYSAVHTNTQATPHVTPPDPDLSHLPAWAVQPGLGDLYSWFDLPAGLFQADTMGL